MNTLEKDLMTAEIVKQTNLQHIAIIMDGNRRWAKERNLPSAVGHKKGVEALKATLRACNDFGIKYLTVYAFSTENWNRKKEEVDFLMELLALTLTNELAEMHSEGVVINFIGDISKLSPKLQKIILVYICRLRSITVHVMKFCMRLKILFQMAWKILQKRLFQNIFIQVEFPTLIC